MAKPAQPRHGEQSRTNTEEASARRRPAGGVGAVRHRAAPRGAAVLRSAHESAGRRTSARNWRARTSPIAWSQPDELERVAGSVMHGGIVALAQPQPVPILDLAKARQGAGRAAASRCCCSTASAIRTISARSSGPPPSSGFPRIVLSDHPAQAGPSDASYRVAEGGLEYVELHRGVRFAHTLQRLRRSYRVIGTAAENGQPIEALRRAERPFAVVLGNEEHGLPPATLAACERSSPSRAPASSSRSTSPRAQRSFSMLWQRALTRAPGARRLVRTFNESPGHVQHSSFHVG